MDSSFFWKTNLTASEWDHLVTTMGGHPLQTAAWGQAKKISHPVVDHYWIAYQGKQPVFLVRFEEKRYVKLIKLAWIPKGPIVIDPSLEKKVFADFLTQIKKNKFLFCIIFPWKAIESNPSLPLPQTIWIDLSIGKETIWKQTNKRFRHSVRQALKAGVLIEQTENKDDILKFFSLCTQLSEQKKFKRTISLAMIQALLVPSDCEQFECRLFIARYQSNLCGGAFIIRCGEQVHYFWGAVDRSYGNKTRIGEILQWSIIEWSLNKKCKLYDLEDIDIKNNPGVYQFKKKLNGKIMSFPGPQIFPSNDFTKSILSCFKGLQVFLAKLDLIRLKMLRICSGFWRTHV